MSAITSFSEEQRTLPLLLRLLRTKMAAPARMAAAATVTTVAAITTTELVPVVEEPPAGALLAAGIGPAESPARAWESVASEEATVPSLLSPAAAVMAARCCPEDDDVVTWILETAEEE